MATSRPAGGEREAKEVVVEAGLEMFELEDPVVREVVVVTGGPDRQEATLLEVVLCLGAVLTERVVAVGTGGAGLGVQEGETLQTVDSLGERTAGREDRRPLPEDDLPGPQPPAGHYRAPATSQSHVTTDSV